MDRIDAATALAAPRRRFASMVRPGARVTPEHARSHNRALVLQELFRGEGLSRADLARATGLTRVTISDLITDLIDERLVVETGQRAESRPGKPAIMLDINRTGFAILALDLSKAGVFLGVVTDLDGVISHREEVAVEGLTGGDAVEAVAALIERLLAATQAPVLGVGVGSPGIVDEHGRIVTAPNLGWHEVALQQILAERLRLPVVVANDANAAALGERSYGGADDLILIRVGLGVGAGLVVGGTLVSGARYAAGEIGHVVVGTDGGDACVCGRRGCLETWLATPRLTARLAAHPESRAQILAEAGERLGIALAPVVGALNLEEVVLSGPFDTLDGPLIETAAETIRDRTMAASDAVPAVRMTTLGRDIVVLGAVVMVLSGQLGVS
ncbi:ROK family transcriptional regulator [Demequina pelophila]|uniref:ROK family transcriptional regulator n=1 Tax=Demequina pelophila TaxID=1638984 RepID=UPI000AEEA922|nr:ROK family transcriptional regulator [Demequina pelophila]